VPQKIGFHYAENYPGSDITADEWEFLKAVERYQRAHGRRYPSWREVLSVLKSLGYRRVAPPTDPPKPPDAPQPPAET
jgi:hypothetical protein